MLYTVFIAICLSSTPVSECGKNTAIDWMAAPEQQNNLSACMVHGMQYTAESNLLKGGDYPKVF